MVPPAPQIRWKHTIILLHLQCSGGVHGTSSASNTLEDAIIYTLENIIISSSASNTVETLKNIVIFAMLRRSSWYLQRLKCNEKYNNIVTFTMFRRYSWYLQRLKYAEQNKNTIISVHLQYHAHS